MTTGPDLRGVLRQLGEDCEQVRGVVLATDEGLVVEATGSLETDTAAASAAQLAQCVEQHLSLIVSTACVELLVWGAASAWYLTRVSERFVLMVHADADCHVGGLRLASRKSARRLRALLSAMA